MSAVAKPERAPDRAPLRDINLPLLIAEAAPAQIRECQRLLRENLEERIKLRAQLEQLVAFAVERDIELCPTVRESPRESGRENGNAAGPGGADGASIRGVA